MVTQSKRMIVLRTASAFFAIVTVVLAVYAARPWGDNYAYQDVSGYLFLALIMLWAIAPYIYFYLTAGRGTPGRTGMNFRLGGSLLISIAGAAAVFDATLIHIDAQGGLILLFASIYQGLLIGVMVLVLVLWRKFAAEKGK